MTTTPDLHPDWRPAQISDLHWLAEAQAESYLISHGQGVPATMAAQMAARTRAAVVDDVCNRVEVLALNDVPVGYYWLRMEVSEDPFLVDIFVSGKFRRQGHATRMLRRVIRAARIGCAQGVRLAVSDTNAAALRIYESFGGVVRDRSGDGMLLVELPVKHSTDPK